MENKSFFYADAIIKIAYDLGIHDICPMKLQKIMYFSHVYSLKMGKPLFSENFYAWQYGPVLPEIYYKFSAYGSKSIPVNPEVDLSKLDESDQFAIVSTLNNIGNISGWDLSMLTHVHGSAWSEAIKNRKPILDTNDIKNDYNLIN